MGFKMGRFERILSSLLVIVIMSTMVIDPLATAKAMSSKDSDKTALDYTIFSGSSSQDFNLSCWKSNIKGDVYTGRSFNYSGSELYLKGDIDARRKINTSGWIIKIDAQNIKAPFISMPDLDEVIHERAEQYEYYEGSKNFNQEKILVHNSIKVEDNINFNGSIFEGNCYVIAGGDIRYNVNTLNCQSDNTVVFYSENGDIVISGSDITINGILYAPKGKVQFNVNTLTLNGRIIADSVEFSGSQFNIYGAPEDLELITRPGISKIYTLDEDFLEGDLDGTSLSVPDQLVLAEREDYTSTGLESIYGDKGSNKGVKISSIIDKTVLNPSGDHFNITYNLNNI